jgi:hypothetical protein
MIETIIISVLTTVILFLVGGNIYQHFRYRRISAKLLEVSMNQALISENIGVINNGKYVHQDVADSDGFLKFLSDSREWAFGYIEEVQEAILKLSDAMQSGNEDKIHVAYIHLMTYLPTESANN